LTLEASSRFFFEWDNLFVVDSFKQSAETAGRAARAVDVMRCRDGNVSVAQKILRSGQTAFAVYNRTGFFCADRELVSVR
jgi:hypothetical protein